MKIHQELYTLYKRSLTIIVLSVITPAHLRMSPAPLIADTSALVDEAVQAFRSALLKSSCCAPTMEKVVRSLKNSSPRDVITKLSGINDDTAYMTTG